MKFNNLNKNVKSMLSNEYHYCISMGFEKKNRKTIHEPKSNTISVRQNSNFSSLNLISLSLMPVPKGRV
jgi:hypothetical protein